MGTAVTCTQTDKAPLGIRVHVAAQGEGRKIGTNSSGGSGQQFIHHGIYAAAFSCSFFLEFRQERFDEPLVVPAEVGLLSSIK